jgi:hypothetical protein
MRKEAGTQENKRQAKWKADSINEEIIEPRKG